MNKVILIGNLTKKPEVSTIQNGNTMCKCSLATNETYNDKETGEKKSIVDYHNIVIWGKSAENFSRYTNKGSKVCVEGQIKTNSYEKNGVKMYATQVVVRSFEFLNSKKENNNEQTFDAGEPPATEMPF